MTKEEMLKEINFPVYTHRSIPFTIMDYENKTAAKHPVVDANAPSVNYNIPSVGAWIICVVPVQGMQMTGLYKWQEKDNPDDITHWAYINIDAPVGLSRMVEYKHASHPHIILICDEKQKDFKIEPKKTNPNIN